VQGTADSVEVGHDAQFQVTVWPLGGEAEGITVQVSSSTDSLPAATFTTCGDGDGSATCTVGDLNANQSTQLDAQISVPSDASTSAAATLAAEVTGTATGATTSGSVSSAAQTSLTKPPPPPTKHHSGGSGSGGSGGSGSGSGSGNDNSDLGSGLGTGTGTGTGDTTPETEPTLSNPSGNGSVGDPSGLFPTINPGAKKGSHSKALSGPYKPSTVADVLPLNTSQVGSQVAGLVVLAIGIIIAIARVSLRKPKPTTGKD
jgi:hypothetical protein